MSLKSHGRAFACKAIHYSATKLGHTLMLAEQVVSREK